VQRKWVSEWDCHDPGWRWDDDYMAIANPKFLLNLLSDNEKEALRLQDNPARSLYGDRQPQVLTELAVRQ
jgi:hypothetical protein